MQGVRLKATIVAIDIFNKNIGQKKKIRAYDRVRGDAQR
jgi:hypothetical protein